MSGFHGADTEQLREQAGACLRGSGTLRDLIGTTSAMVGAVEWTGPDADAFRERWQSEVRAQLTARADALRARADELTAQAEEQDGASDGDGSGGGPFGSPLPFPFPFPFELPGPCGVPGGAARPRNRRSSTATPGKAPAGRCTADSVRSGRSSPGPKICSRARRSATMRAPWMRMPE